MIFFLFFESNMSTDADKGGRLGTPGFNVYYSKFLLQMMDDGGTKFIKFIWITSLDFLMYDYFSKRTFEDMSTDVDKGLAVNTRLQCLLSASSELPMRGNNTLKVYSDHFCGLFKRYDYFFFNFGKWSIRSQNIEHE